MTDSFKKSMKSFLSSVIFAGFLLFVAYGETRSTTQYKNTMEGDDLWSGIEMPEISYFAGENALFVRLLHARLASQACL
jgi:hypothetical protein